MGLDEGLVREAEAARARLLDARHAAERARDDYHQAIRRLHAAGGSLREIAEALRLSHQRVHQIVEEAEPARPWWRRGRRGRRGTARVCSFCGRSREQSGRLIAGPGVCICDRCVTRARRLGAGGPVEAGIEAPLRLEPSGSEVRCGFCGKEAAQVRFLAASGPAGAAGRLAGAPGGKPGQGARICAECLDLCVEILAEPSPS